MHSSLSLPESNTDVFERHGMSRVVVDGRTLAVEFKSSGMGRVDWEVTDLASHKSSRVYLYQGSSTLTNDDPAFIEAVKRLGRWMHAEFVRYAVRHKLPLTPLNPAFRS